MQALTIIEPWATLIAIGAKHFTTGGRYTERRGRVAICAGDVQYMDGDTSFQRTALRRLGARDVKPGNIIAVADLTACLQIVGNTWNKQGRRVTEAALEDGTVIKEDELALGFWNIGGYAWKFEHVEAVTPIATEPRYGFWEWEGPP